jgi:DNA-directed RNA polymerase specialized sigma24 family protein
MPRSERRRCDEHFDAALIQGFLRGEELAFERYAEIHKGMVYRSVIRRGVLMSDAPDVVQEAFFQFAVKIKTAECKHYQHEPDRLLNVIARRRAIDAVRKRSTRGELDLKEAEKAQVDDDYSCPLHVRIVSAYKLTLYNEIIDFVKRLNRTEQVVFAALVNGESHEDVASTLGVTVAYARLMRHRVTLKISSHFSSSRLTVGRRFKP